MKTGCKYYFLVLLIMHFIFKGLKDLLINGKFIPFCWLKSIDYFKKCLLQQKMRENQI